jgi:hypothetical protein
MPRKKTKSSPAKAVKKPAPAPTSPAGGVHKIAPQTDAARRLRQEVIERADRHQVQVVNLWFTDIVGQLKSFVVPRH